MNISSLNREDANNVCVHDAVFLGFNYNYQENIIEFSCEEYFYSKRHTFKFNNVFGFQMKSCDYWGASPRIYAWELKDVSENIYTQALASFRSDEKNIYSRMTDSNEVLESTFILISGDELTIVCESIDYKEEKLAEGECK